MLGSAAAVVTVGYRIGAIGTPQSLCFWPKAATCEGGRRRRRGGAVTNCCRCCNKAAERLCCVVWMERCCGVGGAKIYLLYVGWQVNRRRSGLMLCC